ncbi:hypothetical protein EYV94_05915 [Puteibacter caeruleilacunae]|nr:hypothetical protein EYV94_05915 [Puteibacter caeruleilacunae]
MGRKEFNELMDALLFLRNQATDFRHDHPALKGKSKHEYIQELENSIQQVKRGVHPNQFNLGE